MATAASSTVIGISPKNAQARDSYQAAPAEAVSTSNHASSPNKVAVTAATGERCTDLGRSRIEVSTSPGGDRIREDPDLIPPSCRDDAVVIRCENTFDQSPKLSDPIDTVVDMDEQARGAWEVTEMAGTADHERRTGADSAPGTAELAGLGMSWGWDVDLEQVLDVLTGPAQWLRQDSGEEGGAGRDRSPVARAVDEADPEADEAEYREAMADGRVEEMPLTVVAGRLAEWLPTGPVLAGWLAHSGAAVGLEDGALAGVALSFRRLASWAAAGELAAVAQIAARSARTDRRATVDGSGRPDRVTSDAAGQVSLALAMSLDGAVAWADLGVVLGWRLRATGAALTAGEIDLARARMIVRMTSGLSDADARLVEAMILGRAGRMTLGQLHSALRRAVIKVDPAGAEKRREQAEKNAKVVLYPEDEGTASLGGYALPGVQAAEAMARITALARAMKAAGTDGKIDLIRAQIFLSLLLGTFSDIPPDNSAAGPEDSGPRGPEDDGPGGGPENGEPGPGGDPGDGEPGSDPAGEDDEPDDDPPADPDLPRGRRGRGRGLGDLCPGGPGGGIRASPNRARPPRGGAVARTNAGHEAPRGEAPGPGVSPGPVGPAHGPPASESAGLLKLTVPLATLTGASAAPGQLSRLGVVTPQQARQIATIAARHRATDWRGIVCDPAGQAQAVAHVPRSRSPGACGDGYGDGDGRGTDDADVGSHLAAPGPAAEEQRNLVGRVTLVTSTEQLGTITLPEGAALASIVTRAQHAAARAAAEAAERGRQDADAGGCAHQLASDAYRPPPRIAELVKARDGTCRFATCRRHADQCDLDHVQPYDQGGKTCPCNLGAQCRSHHQLKQDPRWILSQTTPGVFRWTTPAGRSYTVRPDPLLI
jgi:hypothetical protein